MPLLVHKRELLYGFLVLSVKLLLTLLAIFGRLDVNVEQCALVRKILFPSDVQTVVVVDAKRKSLPCERSRGKGHGVKVTVIKMINWSRRKNKGVTFCTNAKTGLSNEN